MDAASPFLQLPREIRDQIYIQYFSSPDGTYVFDFHSKKLRNPDGSPIDVALMATCKTIANEARGVALRTNTITFYTIYSDELRILACRFHQVFRRRYVELKSIFGHFAPAMDHTKMEAATDRHPILIPTIREYHLEPGNFSRGDWTDVPSRGYFASLDALRCFLPSLPPGETLPFDSRFPLPSDRKFLHNLVAFEMNPWEIPVEYELRDVLEVAAGIEIPTDAEFGLSYFYDRTWYPDHGKYRFSAAAAAIYFLRCATPETRSHIRNILICEDHTSVASPECHALGLIPFCQENPALRVIRRASLWNNIFLTSRSELLWQEQLHMYFNTSGYDSRLDDFLDVEEMTRTVAAWMSEVGILTSMGMPTGQFTFTLDGDPMPEKTYEIFSQHIQRAALWQEIMTKAPRYGEWCSYHQRSMEEFFYDDFPRLLGDLSKNWESGLIQCNFDPGSPVGSADEILATHPDWDFMDWETELAQDPRSMDIAKMPEFAAMFLHNNMTESYCQRFPNGPPKGSQIEAPDWNEEWTSDEEGGDVEGDDAEEADAHEGDV